MIHPFYHTPFKLRPQHPQYDRIVCTVRGTAGDPAQKDQQPLLW
jgi:hypothetical protein